MGSFSESVVKRGSFGNRLNFLQTKDLWNIRHQVDHRL